MQNPAPASSKNRPRDAAKAFIISMGRKPCCDKVGLKKGQWTAEEDKKLVDFILNNGHCCWRVVPKLAGLLRCGKSCRLRWTNYLRPDLKRGELSNTEEQLIMELHGKLGNRWAKITAYLPGRTDNEIKNYWNTHIKKKLRRMGIDPLTHQPIADSQSSAQLNRLPRAVENNEAKGAVEPKRVAETLQRFEPGPKRFKEVVLSVSTNQAEPDEKIIDSLDQPIHSVFGVHAASMFVEDVKGSNPGSSTIDREKTFNEYLGPEVGSENTLLFHPQDEVPSVLLQGDDSFMWELGDFVGCFAKKNPTAMGSFYDGAFNMDTMAAGSILAPVEMNCHPWEHGMDPFLEWEGTDVRSHEQAFCTELQGLVATLDTL